jgi:N-acetylmuramoyl-L-alanine amidase
VLRHTIMPAILIECCFVDSAKDMALYDANKMAIAICNGLLGINGDYSQPKQNYLKVLARTPLKPSTDQAAALPDHQLVWIDPGKYPIKRFLPEEEGHFWIESADGKSYFVFAGHSEIF